MKRLLFTLLLFVSPSLYAEETKTSKDTKDVGDICLDSEFCKLFGLEMEELREVPVTTVLGTDELEQVLLAESAPVLASNVCRTQASEPVSASATTLAQETQAVIDSAVVQVAEHVAEEAVDASKEKLESLYNSIIAHLQKEGLGHEQILKLFSDLEKLKQKYDSIEEIEAAIKKIHDSAAIQGIESLWKRIMKHPATAGVAGLVVGALIASLIAHRHYHTATAKP